MDMKILPADTYRVINKSIITDYDKQVIDMLYLPLVGAMPIMLYYILLNDLDKDDNLSDILEHAKLLSSMHVSIDEFISARSSLEAIGLLKTYLKSDTVNKYIYELYSPVSSHEFFSHPLFNIVLYNNVGKKEYDKLVAYFCLPKISKDGYQEITKKFSDVFEMQPYTSADMYNDNIKKYNKLNLNIASSFDINLLIETMPSNTPRKIFTKDVQELIILLAYLYDIDVSRMQNLIMTCINERGLIDRNELRIAARNYYKFDHSGALPTMINCTQPAYLRKPIGDTSKMAKMIYTFETVSPYDFLKSKHNGAEPPPRDVLLLENLLVDCKLKPGVVNVLIDYVLKTQDNKLNHNYVESIAGQWSRKKIETVEEAMDYARKMHKANSKNNKTNKGNKKEMIVPIWLDKDVLAEEASYEEQQEMDELLKEYK